MKDLTQLIASCILKTWNCTREAMVLGAAGDISLSVAGTFLFIGYRARKGDTGVGIDEKQYANYVAILREELLPAMGCTEPIAVALAAARAREVLGQMPERMEVCCSGNIVKNVKGVVVPNSGGQRGIAPAAVLGVVAGQPDKGLEVIAAAGPEAIAETRELCQRDFCQCSLAEDEENLYIRVSVHSGQENAAVEIRTQHDHIARIEKNGKVILEQKSASAVHQGDKSRLDMDDILTFADTVRLEDVAAVIDRQIAYNSRISEEGLHRPWGCWRRLYPDEGKPRRCAHAGQGSSCCRIGCTHEWLLFASGHQFRLGQSGITCTMPVVTYAKQLGVSEEKLKTGFGADESGGTASEIFHRQLVGLLWSGVSRSRSRLWHCLSLWGGS
jgi:L-cysteine desulfidase